MSEIPSWWVNSLFPRYEVSVAIILLLIVKSSQKKEENRIWDKRSWEDRCNLMEINEVLSCNVKANRLTPVTVIDSESLDYLLGK